MLSKKAIKTRNDYYKEWRKNNKDKVRKYYENYWKKKAENINKEDR